MDITNMLIEMIRNPYIMLLVVVAVITLLFIFFWYRRMIKGSDLMINKLVELHSDSNEMSVKDKINDISAWMEEEVSLPKDLQESWHSFSYEYRKTGVIPDVFEHFTEEILVSKYGNRKFVEAIPAIFLSLGILGTFYGITTGVESINQNGSTEVLQSGISNLMSGMQVAFYSSIAGIILSLLLQVIDRMYLYKILLYKVRRLKNHLDQVFPLKTESHLLLEMIQLQKYQGEQIKETLENGFNSISNKFENIVKVELLPSFKENKQALISKLNDLHHTFDHELVPKLSGALIDLYNEKVKPVMNESNKIHQQNSVTIEQLSYYLKNDYLHDYLNGLQQVFDHNVKPLLIENNEKLENQQQHFINKFPVTLRETVTLPITTKIQDQRNDLELLLQEDLETKLTELVTVPIAFQMEENRNLLTKQTNIFTDVYRFLQEDLDKQMNELLNQQKKNNTIIDNQTSSIQNSAKKVSIQLKEQHEYAIKEMNRGNNEIVSLLNEQKHQSHQDVTEQTALQERNKDELILLLNSQYRGLVEEVGKGNEQLFNIQTNLLVNVEKSLKDIMDYYVKNVHKKAEAHVEKLGEVMHQTVSWQKTVHEELESLIHSLHDVAERQMDMSTKTHSLTDSLVAYTDKLQLFSNEMYSFTDTIISKQERLSESAKHLLDVSMKNEQVSREFGTLIESLTNERTRFQYDLGEKMQSFLGVLNIMENQGETLKEIQDEMGGFIGNFTEATKGINELTSGNKVLASVLQRESSRSKEMIGELHILMDSVLKNNEQLQSFQDQGSKFINLLISERSKMDELKHEEYQLLKDQLVQYDERMNQLIAFWRKNAEQLKKTQNQFTNLSIKLDQTIDEATVKMENGLTKSFDHFGKQLSTFIKTQYPQNKSRF